MDINNYYNNEIKEKSAEIIGNKIYTLVSNNITDGVVKDFNDAVRGFDVRDDFTKLAMLLRAYFGLVRDDADASATTATNAAAALSDAITQLETLTNIAVQSGEANPYTDETYIAAFGSSFNNAPHNKLICGAFGDQISEKPEATFRGYVLTLPRKYGISAHGILQIAVAYGVSSGGAFYYRSIEGAGWSDWNKILTESEFNAANAHNFRSYGSVYFDDSTFAEEFNSTSFNGLPVNVCIAVSVTSTITEKPKDRFRGYVWSVSNNKNHNGCVQFALEFNSAGNRFYFRSCEAATWHEWKQIGVTNPYEEIDITTAHNIILMGDSIVKGVGSADMSQDDGSTSPILIYYPGDPDDPTSGGRTQHRNTGVEAWGARFADYMDKRYGIHVYNNGVAQITMGAMVSNFDYDPAGSNDEKKKGLGYLTPERDRVSTVTAPDLIICVAGINNRNSNTSTFKNAVSNYIDKCQTANIPLIMLSPVDMGTYHSTLSTQPAMMNKIIRDVCYEKGVPFYDLYSEFNEMIAAGSSVTDFSGSEYATHVATYYKTNDDLHPSSKGHMLIFHCIRKLLHL